MSELFIAYIEFAQMNYMKNGKQTGEVSNIIHAMRSVVQLYQNCRVSEFGPRALKHVRELMVKDELSRKAVYARVNRIPSPTGIKSATLIQNGGICESKVSFE